MNTLTTSRALVGEFSDPGVSGTDPIEARPGFAAPLDRIETFDFKEEALRRLRRVCSLG
jgi:hypothetical protein